MRSGGLLTCVATAGLLLLPAVPAFAGPGGWVDVDADDDAVDLGATDEGGSDAVDGSAGQSLCTWAAVPEGEVDSLPWGAGEDGQPLGDDGQPVTPQDFDWYWVTCADGEGGDTLDLVPVPRDAPSVDPATLRDEAIDRLSLPLPTIAMNPTGDQIVHVASWLWIDEAIWQTHAKSVTAGGVTTTVTATPRRVVWDLGNGDSTICEGPGVSYDTARSADEQTTDCSYTYAHTSAGQPDHAYQVTATIEWEVSWSVTGAAGGGPLPALFTTSPVPVRVAEMQALNQ